MVQVLIDNVTYYLLQYITCYYGSFNAPWQKSKCSLLVGIRRLSRCALWRNILRFFKQFCGELVPKSPVLLYPILHCSFMPTTCCQYQLHCFLRWHRQTLSSSQHDLVLVKKILFATVYFTLEFKYRMHTNYCGTYISWMPSEWGIFAIIFLLDIVCQRFCDHCSNHRAAREVLHTVQVFTEWYVSQLKLLRNTTDTVTTRRHVFDLSTYVHRYAVSAFVAIMCTNKSGRFQKETVCTSYWFP